MSIIPNLKYKTTLCENWIQVGNCYKGNNCHFAHGEHQLRSISDNQKIIAEQNSYIKAVTEQTTFPSNYKTIKCRFYDKGLCEFGDNCTFVHDNSERREKNHLQNYGYYMPWSNYNVQSNENIYHVPYPSTQQNWEMPNQQQKIQQNQHHNFSCQGQEKQQKQEKKQNTN